MKTYKTTMAALTIAVILNLLFTASIISLIGGIIILVMIWGIKKGDYALRGALAVVVFLHAGVNLVGLLTAVYALISGTSQVSILSTIWLLLFTAALLVFGMLLRSKELRDYLSSAPQPEQKEKKIHFFHGGWRDL